MPAYTFDNVSGNFPISFKIWDTANKIVFKKTLADVYDEKSVFIGQKELSVTTKGNFINKWISRYKVLNEKGFIGFLAGTNGNDFQQNGIVYILNTKEQMANPRGIWIGKDNLTQACIYFAIRKSIDQTWLNDRDQFLCPNDGWQKDTQFQNDCLAFTLFSNGIQSQFGINHWIPFTEQEVKARTKFGSCFMTDFINGKERNNIAKGETVDMLNVVTSQRTAPLVFSTQAQAVFSSGLALWQYYHQQPNCNVNASLYVIREHFQGRNDSGKMNNKSDNATYMNLIKNLREQLKLLQKNIEPKVYEYGFLK